MDPQRDIRTRLWFVQTDLGWIETFLQLDAPVFSVQRQMWVGRMIHPFGERDAKVMRMGLTVHRPVAFNLLSELSGATDAPYFLERGSFSRLIFCRRRRFLRPKHITTFCGRLIRLLRVEQLPIGGRMYLVPHRHA